MGVKMVTLSQWWVSGKFLEMDIINSSMTEHDLLSDTYFRINV